MICGSCQLHSLDACIYEVMGPHEVPTSTSARHRCEGWQSHDLHWRKPCTTHAPLQALSGLLDERPSHNGVSPTLSLEDGC
jgi:hypothetical protein